MTQSFQKKYHELVSSTCQIKIIRLEDLKISQGFLIELMPI